MASVILKTAGAALGNAILPGLGGMLLGGLGAGIGGMVDGRLGLGAHVAGPRLDTLAVQDSRYGAPIATVYGNARVAGNVIWSTDLIQTQHDSTVGGKGGSLGGGVTTTTYSYSVHCAVGICAGPIGGIDTIWADSTVIYQNGVWSPGVCDGATIYTGSAGQTPDAFMQSILGSGNAPSCQGLAYIVFDNLQLANFGNRLPNLTFEIAASATNNPELLPCIDASLSQQIEGVQGGTMLPIVLQGGSSNVQTILVGGYVTDGTNTNFTVAEYDVTEETPVHLARVSSASFVASSPADCAWAPSPDGRFVALYLQNSYSVTHRFALYDTESGNFGAIYAADLLSGSSPVKQIAWLDSLRFVIDDTVGTERGLRVFARAGTGIVDLGFTALWGAGSLTGTSLLYGAQFTPYAGGLIAYTSVTTAPNVITLQARTVVWRDNALSLGAIYDIATGLALGSGSGAHARFVQTSAGEWVLLYGTVLYYKLLSFEPGASSASITRAWQEVDLSFGTGTTNFPVFYGDRLVILQRGVGDGYYRLSEVMLASGSFSLTIDGALSSGTGALTYYFGALRLDGSRILLMGMGGFSYDIGQLGIVERHALGSVGAVMADILARAGYDTGDYDISALNGTSIQGYVLQGNMSARSAIEPLQAYIPFDLIESGGQLKAVLRGGAVAATIPSSEMRAAVEKKPQPPASRATRAQEMDLPREIDVDFIDPARNFEVNCQRARRIATNARAVQKISLPVVCDAGTAKQIAETRLYTAWAERDLVKISVSRAWLALDPGDVVDPGNGDVLRVTSILQSGGLVEVEGFYTYAAVQGSAAQADGGQNIAANANAPPTPALYLMDLPLLRSADDQPGVYAAATALFGWNGATIMRSSDGTSYSAIGSLPLAATAGIATDVLADASGFYMDNESTVSVQMLQGALSSCSFIDMTNGTNAALLGGEIIQFQTATLVGPGLYRLSNLLRGRRGTESAINTHNVGEAFVLLQEGAVDFIPD
ncbi:MAG: phage tail protein, partial [Alphaproteobacteria bacterium]|nr:phage tail protein [Alphaproteobacteria bacterium]